MTSPPWWWQLPLAITLAAMFLAPCFPHGSRLYTALVLTWSALAWGLYALALLLA